MEFWINLKMTPRCRHHQTAPTPQLMQLTPICTKKLKFNFLPHDQQYTLDFLTRGVATPRCRQHWGVNGQTIRGLCHNS